MGKKMRRDKRFIARQVCCFSLTAFAAASGHIWAQTVADAPLPTDSEATNAASPANAAMQLQTLTVTATRRKENVKNVPVSASLISDDALNAINTGGQDLTALAGRAPSLNAENSDGRAFPRFYMRGYGNTDFHINSSQPVSLVYDDIVLENSVLKGFPAFDLQQIEILRGPQGTLFGRNTPAGVVKLNSAPPEHKFGGYISASEGTNNTANLEGAINVPINEQLAARISFLDQHKDNWIGNTAPGQTDKHYGGYNENALRFQLLYKPNTDFSALLNVHEHRSEGSASLFRANIIQPGTNNLVPGFDIGKVQTDGANGQHLESYGTDLHLQWTRGDYTLHSITGYETVHFYTLGDIDGGYGAAYAPPSGPGFIPFSAESADGLSNHHQLTQEFRVESKYTGPLNWQAGVFFFNEAYRVGSYSYDSLHQNAFVSKVSSRQADNASAIFGSLKYDVNTRLSLTGGLRFTDDRKTLRTDPNDLATGGSDIDKSKGLSASTSDKKLNWDFSTLYKLTNNTNLYSRVATSFRGSTIEPAGPFNPMSVAQPETVLSYEGGVKSDLFNRRARVSFDVYHFDVKNQQLSAVGGTTNSTVLVNAKKAAGQGAELDFQTYLAENLLFTTGGSYNYTQIQDPNLQVAVCAACTVKNPVTTNAAGVKVASINGNPLPNAPKWNANFTLRYSIPFGQGELYAFTDWVYRSQVNFTLYNSDEFVGKSSFIGGLRVGYLWDNDRYELAAFARNITNQVRLVGGIDFNNLTGYVNDNNARLFGVQFKARF
ncbi:iron complex outermembrane recepter protein [Collimonas sp. OK307]|uniref:TonB-dependent receptor n=1 Tax=Collimonas sp. OK307 TaxID=1801620 RepID=UPI0008E5D208|nr:TonB-dependent receptor [Collimonas sp. OK307]SFI37966.1 iron complex outermembrane recepter protein [Collimonas sp. OK307]